MSKRITPGVKYWNNREKMTVGYIVLSCLAGMKECFVPMTPRKTVAWLSTVQTIIIRRGSTRVFEKVLKRENFLDFCRFWKVLLLVLQFFWSLLISFHHYQLLVLSLQCKFSKVWSFFQHSSVSDYVPQFLVWLHVPWITRKFTLLMEYCLGLLPVSIWLPYATLFTLLSKTRWMMFIYHRGEFIVFQLLAWKLSFGVKSFQVF